MAVDTSAIKNTSTIDDAISAARIELLKLNLSEEQIKSVEEELARIAKDYDTNPTKTTEEEIKIDLNFDDSLLMEEESSELPSEVVTYEQQKQNCIDSSGKWENSKCQCPEGFTTNDTGTCVDANSSDVAEYCPATGNGLSSITDKTKIGDFCSSSNIAEGEVVRRKDKTCTCRASACNACCYSQNGQCKKRGANDTNNCPRQVYKNVQNINNSNDALKFCESKATNNCKVSKAIINYKKVKGQILCNPASEDLPCPSQAYPETNENNTKEKCQSFCQAKSKENKCSLKSSVMRFSTKECVCNPDKDDLRTLNMYKEVCGKDKGQGVCIDNVFTNKTFGGTQVDTNTAKGLSAEWARVKGYREIVCSDKEPREISVGWGATDYGIQCVSKDADKNGNRTYFEFIFDDVKETMTLTVANSFVKAVVNGIYGYEHISGDSSKWKTGTEENCNKVIASIKRICPTCQGGGWHQLNSGQKVCWIGALAKDLSVENQVKNGKNAFDIDPFVFCKEAQSQLRNTGNLDTLLKEYISSKSNYPTSKIECFAKTTTYCSGGCKCDKSNVAGAVDPGDDLKTCVVHGDKDYYIYFVFDDILEFSKKREKGALQSMACVVNGGVFNGQECKFADKKQCDVFIASSKKTCPQCTPPKWNPDTQLCEVPDAAAVTKMEKTEKTVMIVGGVVVSVAVTVATAGAGAPVFAVILGGAEVAGGAMEYFAQQKIDSMAHEFFLESAKCNSASCAKKTIEDNLQQMANIMNDLEPYEISALDAEFTRLLGLLDPDSEFYNNIVTKGATLADNQKGFFDPEGWNQAQVWRAIGIGLQFASLGTGLIKKIVEAPKFAAKFPKTQAFLTKQIKLNKLFKKGAQVADVSKDVVEVTSAQAKKLDELESEIAKLESKTNRTEAEAEKLKKLHQERNTLLNKVGTKDADEIAKAKNVAYDKKAVQQAQSEYDEIMKQRDYVEDYMAKHNGNPPNGMSKQRIQELNDKVATAEKKLKDLGQDVTPKEPLQIGKKPTAKPADAKPVETTPKPEDAKPAENPTSPDSKPATTAPKTTVPDAKELQEIEDALGDRYKNIKPELKNNPDRTAVFGKDYLTDTEWETLNKSLAKENLEVVPSGDVMFIRQKRVFPDAISDIRNRAYSEFNTEVNKIKNGTKKELHIPKAHLSDDEWKLLEADLNKEGLEITEANSHYFTVRKSTAKPVPKTPAKPATPAPKAPVATPVTTDISALRSKASKNFEEHLTKVKASKLDKPYGATWNAKNMTEAEWVQLNKTLNQEGVEIVDVIRPDGTPGKRIQRIGAKFEKSVVPDVATIKKKIRSDFDDIIKDIKNENKITEGFVINKSKLSDEEWKILIQDLKKDGLEVVDDGKGNMFISKTKSGKSVAAPNKKPAQSNPVTTPDVPKRTPAQEEAEWRALYKKIAPGNEKSIENFKAAFNNDLNQARNAAQDLEDLNKNRQLYVDELNAANQKAGTLWSDFHKKYDLDDNSFSYGTYSKYRKEAESQGIYNKEIPGLESWSKEQIRDAEKVYEAQRDASKIEAKLSMDAPYSTFDPEISKLKRELHQNTNIEIWKDFTRETSKNNLTQNEVNELTAYVQGKDYNKQLVSDLFNKHDGMYDVVNNTQKKYQEFLRAKSENVQKIDKVAGLHAGVNKTTGELIAKNEFVRNFVSKRVSMYKDIITKNPGIYNRAKRWNQLSIEDREKLCKEIFEIADDKLGLKHTDFAVKDLVKDFGKSPSTEGLQLDGNVYLSSRHFPSMSFEDVIGTIAHEQAHKVDRLSPNKGILGSQLADLGKTEGYIQGYTGHAYADYRKELTEQSSWMIGDEMRKVISKLGL